MDATPASTAEIFPDSFVYTRRMLPALSVAAAVLYALSAALPTTRQFAIALTVASGWLLHGAALWSGAIEAMTVRIGFAVMLSATLWICVAGYWIENRKLPLDGLRILVLPVAAAAAVLPLLFPGTVIVSPQSSPWFSWHIAISVLAYSFLTIAAFHAVLMAFQESRLHRHETTGHRTWLTEMLDRLPPLLAMERLLFRLVASGFLLLTLTVLSGIAFSEQIFGRPFSWDHKIVFALLSWSLFGLLLAGRRWQGWRGRTALGFTLTGFATLLLAYVGSRFVMEVILHRSAG